MKKTYEKPMINNKTYELDYEITASNNFGTQNYDNDVNVGIFFDV